MDPIDPPPPPAPAADPAPPAPDEKPTTPAAPAPVELTPRIAGPDSGNAAFFALASAAVVAVVLFGIHRQAEKSPA